MQPSCILSHLLWYLTCQRHVTQQLSCVSCIILLKQDPWTIVSSVSAHTRSKFALQNGYISISLLLRIHVVGRYDTIHLPNVLKVDLHWPVLHNPLARTWYTGPPSAKHGEAMDRCASHPRNVRSEPRRPVHSLDQFVSCSAAFLL